VNASFAIDVLGQQHDRKAFSSGVAALDRYFREQVTQDVRRRVTACYVAMDAATGKAAGYYTLAASGIPLIDMPEALVKRLPRYPTASVARLGCLAAWLSLPNARAASSARCCCGMPRHGPSAPRLRCLPSWWMGKTSERRRSTVITDLHRSAACPAGSSCR
jgi:hypothetical protein